MDFILSKALWVLAAPGNFLLILLLMGGVLQFSRLRRLGGVALAAGIGGFAAIAILPVGDWIGQPLETRFALPDPAPARVDGIIVLGGAINPGASLEWGQPVLNESAERMTEAVALARRYPDARIAFTGGSGSVLDPGSREGPVAQAFWASLGLEGARVIIESDSRNTWENALLTRDLVNPAEGEVWLLVTSAFHMPRSMGIFRQTGWTVIPWPVGPMTRAGQGLDFELAANLWLTNVMVREWIGLAAYRLMGRTDALFPGPDDKSGT